MTDYPSIKPEDVREGDVVEVTSTITADGLGVMAIRQTAMLGATLRLVSRPAPPEPLCPFSMGETVYVKGAPKPLTVAGWNYYPAWDKWMVRCEDGTQSDDGELAYSLHPPLELTAVQPEPPLRVGDWVMDSGRAEGPWQITNRGELQYAGMVDDIIRIEPPVGWPVGVPDEDGGTTWWVCYKAGNDYYKQESEPAVTASWADLLAAGGVPALAVTR